MDLMDRLALASRRYKRRLSRVSDSGRLNLSEVVMAYDHKAILEASILSHGEQVRRVKPDPERKLKLSLLDMISELQPEADSWYEVFETAPTGDISKVRVMTHSQAGEVSGELRLLMGRRSLENYFAEDPILDSLSSLQNQADVGR